MKIRRVATFVAAASVLLTLASLSHAERIPKRDTLPNALLAIDQNRASVVDKIVLQWGEPLAQSDAGLNGEDLRTMLTALRADHLLAASLAGSLDGLRNALSTAITSTADVKASLVQPQALGDPNADLVYTPVVPCRIVDGVQAGQGPIPGLTNRSFIGTTATNYTAQGGSATNCGIPTSAAAVQTIVTVVSPPAQGFLLIYPFGTNPAGFTAVYQPNQISTTAVTIQLTKGQAYEFTALVEQTTFIHVDVMGYFKAPGTASPKPLDCVRNEASGSFVAAAGVHSVGVSGLCSAGYTLTGGGCWSPFAPGGSILISASTISIADGKWFCSVNNYGASPQVVNIDTICCRTPGLP